MNPKMRKTIIADLEKQSQQLKIEHAKIIDALKVLRREEAREKFNCPCVALNKDLEIYDMAEQHAAGRRGLQCGEVAETFSAKEDCPSCYGKGVWPEAGASP